MKSSFVFSCLIASALVAAAATTAPAQSSSLYVRQEPVATAPQMTNPHIPAGTGALSQAIAAHSYIAVQVPEPRQYIENDLVTIIIRESFKTDLKASLDTEKEMKTEGEITDIIDLDELLNLVVKPDPLSRGTPKIGVDMSNEFEGEGNYSRSETATGRITARIADVKPNGTIILEAKQTTVYDKEELVIILTGTCRAADITVDNTVLSTELYDLHMNKQHSGELKKSTKKGFLTNFFEAVFNF